MADVVLEVTIPDAHVSRVKVAAEGLLANGEVLAGVELKALIENRLRHFIKDWVVQWEQSQASAAARDAAESDLQL